MSMRPDAELPFFFGGDGGLFGMYHPPEFQARRAVLMCAPLGQDLIRCHRIYRQLAQALAGQGLAVLRFDYHGTGDSAGATAAVDWERCVADTVVAAAELRARARVERVVAFGARLGASIAMCAAEDARFGEVIAWDPVLDGGDYVSALDAMQAALREDAERFTRPRSHADVAEQWLGFDIGDRLREQLNALSVGPAGVPAMVLDSLGEAASRVRDRVATARGKVADISPPTPWNDLRRLETAILSQPVIQAVSGRLQETA